MEEKSLKEFVEVLCSAAPVPGGGGASALVGAVGCALGGMVGSLTAGRKKYAGVQEEIEKYGLDLVGVLPQDETVYEYDCDGKPSSQVPDSTPVKQALHQIMRDLNL